MCSQRPKNSQPQHDQQRGHPEQSLSKPAQDRAFEILSWLRRQQGISAMRMGMRLGVTVRVIMRMT
jgi:hypothetical protein